MIDWPKLVNAVALAMKGRRHGRWRVLGNALAFAGLPVEDSTIRGWGHGRSVPRGDVAVWLVWAAEERGIELPMRGKVRDVPCGTLEGACSSQ
jgi:hypothetical protein